MMPRNTDKINPLDFFNLRRVEFCPAHFETIDLAMSYNLEKSIEVWISSNLKGRFYIGPHVTIKKDAVTSKVTRVLRIGFEEKKELSFFTLACPLLKY